MNFSRSAHPHHQGSFVWKRNANTSQTKRKESQNNKKIRLTSESSDYSNLGETQPSLNIQTNPSKSKNKKSEWVEIKSMAKYSTIASRMQLKKSIPVSFLDFTDKKSPKRQKTKSSFEYNTFDRVIDSQGNLTKSFKDTKEFKSLNPHISKDVDRMKKRVYSIYQQQKKKMNNFLGQSETKITYQNSQTQNSKSIGFLTNYDGSNEMQKISERLEYESRINSTRIKENKNQHQKLKQNQRKQIQRSFTKKQNQKHSQQSEPYFIKSTSKNNNHLNQIDKSSSVLTTTTNPLLKGLLGQYSNYQKLSKHQLIQKLISLEYLAQNIFKKNKFLQQQISKKDIQLTRQSNLKEKNKNEQKIIQSKHVIVQNQDIKQKQVQKNRNLFVINNEDGYFNEFLQSQKDKQKQIHLQVQENQQRFHQNLNNF